MGLPAATATHAAVALDVHVVLVPSPGGPVPVPLPHPFSGTVVGGTVPTVLVAGLPAAAVGSTVMNAPPHLPTPPGVAFQKPPSNRGTVQVGSATVLVGGKGAARLTDPMTTCNDPADLPAGQIASGAPTVLLG